MMAQQQQDVLEQQQQELANQERNNQVQEEAPVKEESKSNLTLAGLAIEGNLKLLQLLELYVLFRVYQQ